MALKNYPQWMIGLALLASGCGSGGGAGSSFFVETCSLGCGSGSSGSQVSCGILSTHVNQEVSLLFSQPVDAGTLSKQSFQVFNVQTGQVPPGSYFVDPGNSLRAVFRPKLSFDANGSPQFGFTKGQAYQIRVPGTAQGDIAPFIESTGGSKNLSRVLCTVSTDLDPVDPLPGAPSVSVFVDTVDAVSGAITPNVPASGAVSVSKTSKITLVFNDLMMLGTIVIPSSGAIPFLQFKVDPDGDLGTAGDQFSIGGTITYNLDQTSLVTTAVFTPSNPLPSAGPNAASPRRIVVEMPASITDLVGNGLANAGSISFVPEGGAFGSVTIPTGGEDFNDVTLMDANRTGAFWGEATSGRLTIGRGGGSGRLGDLVVPSGQTKTLYTSPWPAEAVITFTGNPSVGNTLVLGLATTPPQTVTFTFDANGAAATTVKVQPFTNYTLCSLLAKLEASVHPIIVQASYSVREGNKLVITSKTLGTAGQNFTLATSTPAAPFLFSSPTLTGGVDAETFGGANTLTNFDFQANPGGNPAPILVTDGIFEFANIDLKPSSILRFVGTNPPRVFARGRVVVGDLARIDISGTSPGPHGSANPSGQYGGRGGPSGGRGGDGADRQNYAGSDLTTLSTNPFAAAVVFASSFIIGRPGVGVGGVNTGPGSGNGGTFWPSVLPINTTNPGGMETAEAVGSVCVSQQVGGPGSGGAYATDGAAGVPVALSSTSFQGGSNTPAQTPGGNSAGLGIESPDAPPVVRKLTPKFGYLRGGAGGGGGGMHVSLSEWTVASGACITGVGSITKFFDHSAGAGGGAGGAIQLVGGRQVSVNGRVDAGGGAGGSFLTGGLINELSATPGGGGSGGAALLQSRTISLATGPGRVVVQGGVGGTGVATSAGGAGGVGLVRIEGLNTLNQNTLALGILPTDPMDPTSKKWLSVGMWEAENTLPDSFSGAQSCWLKPAGNFLELIFEEDDAGASTVGWDMDVILNLGGPPVTVSYRTSDVFGGSSPQEFWGELLNRDLQFGQTAAPLVVRFQGAKTNGNIADPCNVDVTNSSGGIVPSSLTPWVRHPAELNEFTPKPDIVRYALVFDSSSSENSKLVGVTNLRIRAQPE